MTIIILILIALALVAVGVLSVGLKEDAAETPATGIGGPRQPNADVDVK